MPLEWLIGPVAALAGCIAIFMAGAAGLWVWGGTHREAIARETAARERAERQRDRTIDAMFQLLQTTRIAQETTKEAVQAVKQRPVLTLTEGGSDRNEGGLMSDPHGQAR